MIYRTDSRIDRIVVLQPGSEPSNTDPYVCTAANKEGAAVIAAALNQMFKRDRDRDPSGGTDRYALAALISADVSQWANAPDAKSGDGGQ